MAVGAARAPAGDTMTCTYRGHGAVLAMGAPLDRAFGEILGKADGLCGGKGGSMHLTDVTRRRARLVRDRRRAPADRRRRRVRGRATAGRERGRRLLLRRRRDQHRRVPRGAEPGRGLAAAGRSSCARTTSTASTRRSRRPRRSSGSPTARPPTPCAATRVDGNDVVAVREAAQRRRRARAAGEGPTLIEAMTYRQRGPLAHRPGDLPARGRAGALARARPDHAARGGAGRRRRRGDALARGRASEARRRGRARRSSGALAWRRPRPGVAVRRTCFA